MAFGVAGGCRRQYTALFIGASAESGWPKTSSVGPWITMRFNLVDRIVEVVPGRQIRIVKNLTLGEEYLADHFPTFPVMPGVLMLQTLVEAGAWLLRVTEDFRHSVIVLREARNVKYGSFVEPGRRMTVAVELVETGERLATLKGKG